MEKYEKLPTVWQLEQLREIEAEGGAIGWEHVASMRQNILGSLHVRQWILIRRSGITLSRTGMEMLSRTRNLDVHRKDHKRPLSMRIAA